MNFVRFAASLAVLGAVCGASGAVTDYATLVAAIKDASSGATIEMAAGTYDVAETIVIDKPLTLVGADRATTIVDGKGLVRCFQIKSSNVTIRNLTVQNGAVTGDGAGIYANAGYVGVLVSNCTVKACTSTDGWGAGITFRCDNGLGGWCIVDTAFADCKAEMSATVELKGGALYAVNADLLRCTFTNNQVVADKPRGGAAYLVNHVSLTDCDFVNSTASGSVEPTGGALYIYYPARAGGLTNCLFYGNTVGANGLGGALWIAGQATTEYLDLDGCSFVSNSCGRCYTAVYCGRSLARFNRCLFEGNYDTGEYSDNHMGALYVLNGTPVTECAFVGNRNDMPDAKKYNVRGAALSASGGVGPTPVRRSVFIDNSCNYLGAALMNALANGGFDVADCWFERNRSGIGQICFVEYDNCTPSFRNCMFLKNEAPTQVNQGHLENCSFICNDTTNNAMAAVYINKGTVSLTNCLVYGTTSYGASGTYDFKVDNASRYAAGDVACSYFSRLGSLHDIAEGDAYGNRVGAEIQFVDAAKGDYRVVKADKVVHDGGVTLPWMETKGTCDLGTGPVFSYDDSVRRTGLHIAFANAVKRVRGKSADIGCLEFDDKPGMAVLVR